jgi:hypothetical protein
MESPLFRLLIRPDPLTNMATTDNSCLEIDQLETRIAYGSHICQWIGTK